jgi:hypothetical protein
MWRISCSLWLKKFAPSSQRWVSWIVLAGPDGMGLASSGTPAFDGLLSKLTSFWCGLSPKLLSSLW